MQYAIARAWRDASTSDLYTLDVLGPGGVELEARARVRVYRAARHEPPQGAPIVLGVRVVDEGGPGLSAGARDALLSDVERWLELGPGADDVVEACDGVRS